MAKFILTILIFSILTRTFGQLKPKGVFIGFIPIKNYGDSAKPQYKWFHYSELTFKGDSVYLEQSPVAIYKNDTVYSASDGGFYYYAGTLKLFKGKTVADLTLTSCDYCPANFMKFIPPKINRDIMDSADIIVSDTADIIEESEMIDNTTLKYKAFFIESTKSNNALLVDKILYRRKKKT